MKISRDKVKKNSCGDFIKRTGLQRVFVWATSWQQQKNQHFCVKVEKLRTILSWVK